VWWKICSRKARRFRSPPSCPGADIVFQGATPAVVAEGVEMARPGGRLVSIGVGGGPVTLSPMIFFK
jgi:threonine dehydrogenase-like Zn-dependent dehydrogenase